MSDNEIIDMFTGAYAVLSNFYPVTIMYEDIEYHGVERAVQYIGSCTHAASYRTSER